MSQSAVYKSCVCKAQISISAIRDAAAHGCLLHGRRQLRQIVQIAGCRRARRRAAARRGRPRPALWLFGWRGGSVFQGLYIYAFNKAQLRSTIYNYALYTTHVNVKSLRWVLSDESECSEL